MSGALGWIMIIGAVGTSTAYWFTRGRYESFIVGRFKTGLAFGFWYLFLPYWIIRLSRSASTDSTTQEAKKRILE